MLTINIVKELDQGTLLYHKSINVAGGKPARCIVNGNCKLWKTRPNEFKLPVKYDLKQNYITERNVSEWCLTEIDAIHGISDTHDYMGKFGKINLYVSKPTQQESDTYFDELKNKNPDLHYIKVPFLKITNGTTDNILFRSFNFHTSKHNWRKLIKLHVWFMGPDGFIWYGFQIGYNDYTLHCKRTKARKW